MCSQVAVPLVTPGWILVNGVLGTSLPLQKEKLDKSLYKKKKCKLASPFHLHTRTFPLIVTSHTLEKKKKTKSKIVNAYTCKDLHTVFEYAIKFMGS